ncbi:hypothetical protein IJ750_06385 [bacterium]|nr:hypothetical protein [bacterium]
MNINRIEQTNTFKGFNIQPEARKVAKKKILEKAIALTQDTKYVHLDIVGRDAVPVIRTPEGRFAGTFSNIAMKNGMLLGVHPKQQIPASIRRTDVTIDAYKVSIDDIMEHDFNYLEKSAEQYGVFKPIEIVHDSKDAQINTFRRLRRTGNVYERAAIIVKTLDALVQQALGATKEKIQEDPNFRPFEVIDVDFETLGKKFNYKRLMHILSGNRTVTMGISGQEAVPYIETPYERFIDDCKVKLPNPIYDQTNTLFVKTKWGENNSLLRYKDGHQTKNKVKNQGSNHIFKIRFETEEDAKAAYIQISNARNKYERMALLAKYMDQTGFGRTI